MVVHGTVDPAFRQVRETFAANFERGEIGAACAVSIDDRVVVDLWGGTFERDSIVNAYSVGKPLIAVAVLQQVARGEIDLDLPASRWEPGTRHAYHTNTYGFLAGELLRRTTGQLPGDWLRTLGIDAVYACL